MRIIYYFRELDTPMYWWQRIHFIDELRRNGHEIDTFNPLYYNSADEACEKFLLFLKEHNNYDLFLTCVDQNWLNKETILEIKKMGLPTCLICWDNLELPYKHKRIAPYFDLIWLTSKETQYLFEKWKCHKLLFMPYAANPFTFKPMTPSHSINRIGFIGTPYGSRSNKINELLDAGIECAVYSNSLFEENYNSSVGGKKKFDIGDVSVKAVRYLRFPIGRKVLASTLYNQIRRGKKLNTDSSYLHKERSVSDDMMQKLYSEFCLSLNISELRDTYVFKNPVPKIHLRTFEIPMCYGLQFTSYNPEIADYFEEDKEIILYRSKEEMIDKANYYLDKKNANEVLKIKIAARQRAEREHTWMNRFEKIFKKING